jgi:flagellar hook-associated protein 2
MGQITSNSGLLSGLPTGQLIQRMLQSEQQPLQRLQGKNEELSNQKEAFQQINSSLLSLKESASALGNTDTFNTTSASSSDESVLTASSTEDAVPGSYNFQVNQTVSAQQTLTRGFKDTDSTGLGPGTLSLEPLDARLDRETNLQQLNGGQGVERGKIQITDRSGSATTIDLSDAVELDDVLETINRNTEVNVTARVNEDRLEIRDETGQSAANLAVSDAGDTNTATSLGLAGSAAGDTLTGQQINTIGSETDLATLNDGHGVRALSAQSDIQVTATDGDTFNINLAEAGTVDQLAQTISDQTNGKVSLGIASDGVSLEVRDEVGGGDALSVSARNGSNAGKDLGILGADDNDDGTIQGDRVIAAMNSKLVDRLNGGNGVSLGRIDITNSNGDTTNVDLTGATSVSQVVDTINDANAGVTASLNDAGSGLQIEDTAGGSHDLVIGDDNTTTAADLGIDGTHTDQVADSGNLQYQYITENTRLDTLGVTRGQFTITDSSGDQANVDLTQGNEQTLRDVIQEINSRGLDVNARVNDDGDGLLIEDTGPGTTPLRVEENGSTTAADLGILGEADSAGDHLDGSMQRQVQIESGDTLSDVASKINGLDAGVAASIINDGSDSAPYRLSLSSEEPGRNGGFVFDDGGLGFSATNLAEAQDAQVFYGSHDPANAVVMTSSTNTLEDAIPGATIDLHGQSDQSVQVNIQRDNEAVADQVQKMVEGFNSLVGTLDEYDNYDEEKKEAGLLLGDSTVSRVRRAVYDATTRVDSNVPGQFQTLGQVGITVGDGAQLEFDRDKFMDAMQQDRDAVQQLFTYEQTEERDGEEQVVAQGIGNKLESELDRLTDSVDGVIQRRLDTIDNRVELNEGRMESVQESIEAKRQRLQQQFTQMEEALAEMQSQQQALGQIQNMSSGGGIGGGAVSPNMLNQL